MAEEIYIADKATLDKIKSDTASLVNNFPIDVGISYDDLTRFFKVDNITKLFSPNEQFEVFKITGEGYLFDLNFAATDQHFKPEILIDGRNILDLKTGSDSVGTFIQIGLYDIAKLGSLAANNAQGASASIKTHGPIKFKNSLVLKTTHTRTDSVNNNLYYKIEYGLI